MILKYLNASLVMICQTDYPRLLSSFQTPGVRNNPCFSFLVEGIAHSYVTISF